MVNFIDKKRLFMYILTLCRYYETLVPINWIALSLEGLITPPNGNKKMGIGHFPKKMLRKATITFYCFLHLRLYGLATKK